MAFTPTVDEEKCQGCGECVDVCPVEVFELQGEKSVPVNAEECLGCESCVEVCEPGAITVEEDETEEAVELTTSAKLDKTATQEQAKRDEQALIIAIAKEPKNPELYRQLGEVYLSLDEVADAIESFSTALKFDPENEAIKRKLAKLQPELESEK